jgi:hypothetical protein
VNALTFLVILLVLGAVAVTVMVLAATYVPGRARMSAAEKRRLLALEDLVEELDQLAYSHRELDSVLAPQVIDAIRAGKRRASGRELER